MKYGLNSNMLILNFKIIEMPHMEIVLINAKYYNIIIKILDVLRGLEYAKYLNWYNVATFNLKDYEYFERI